MVFFIFFLSLSLHISFPYLIYFPLFPPLFCLCPLTCPPQSLSTIHPPSPSSISFPLSALSCVSLHAWLAAVIPVSPSVIKGQCRNRCITGRYLTTQHNRPNTLSFVITDSSGKKIKIQEEEEEAGMWSEDLGLVREWETDNICIYRAI